MYLKSYFSPFARVAWLLSADATAKLPNGVDLAFELIFSFKFTIFYVH
jgi:hypothetical protein